MSGDKPMPAKQVEEGTLNVKAQGAYVAHFHRKFADFHFACEIAWEIRRGKRGRMLRNPTYQGITTQVWNSCDFVCGEEAWRPWGVVNCGKGQPGQVADMTHGAAPARFRKVRVGVGYDD